MTSADRCELCMKKPRTTVNGDDVCYDCAKILRSDDEFIASNRGTVHRGNRDDGPHCGARQSGDWATVDADTEEGAVLKFDLVPCTNCIDRSFELGKWRRDLYSARVMHKPGTPEKWKRYARTGELEEADRDD